MKLHTAYSVALKYGRLPKETISAFTENANKENFLLPTHGSHPDHFFADALADAEDPRELIVRKHIQLTEHPTTDMHEFVGKEVDKVAGTDNNYPGNPGSPSLSSLLVSHANFHNFYTNSQSKEDSLYSYKFTGSKGNAYTVHWRPKNKNGWYQAVFNEEEFKEFQDRLNKEFAGTDTEYVICCGGRVDLI